MENPFKRILRSPRDEEPFDPHSVPSIVTIEQQKQEAEIRRHLAMDGEIPQGSVPETGGVDISRFRAPQYSEKNMQRNMDALVPPQEETLAEEGADVLTSPLPEGTPAEWKDTLRKLVEQITQGSKEGTSTIPEREDTAETA